MSADTHPREKAIREPSFLDALILLVFMIALLATSIVLFGLDAAVGPLLVALFMSAVVAAMVAHKNGHSWEKLGEEVVKGISLAMSANMILLMVGALIGVWNMSGTVTPMVWFLALGARGLPSVTHLLSENIQEAAIGLGQVVILITAISLGVLLGTLLVSPGKFVPVTTLGERYQRRKV